MPILSNSEIARALAEGRLAIDPRPGAEPGEPGNPYDETSIALHIGESLWVPKDGLQVAFDLSRPGDIQPTLDAALREVPMPPTGYNLEPGGFALGKTLELVDFRLVEGRPALAGRVEGRSRFARLGLLVHVTAPTIHAAWKGHITLELKNLGAFPIVLKPRSKICQLIVEVVEGDVVVESGAFDRQTTATGA